MSAPTVLVTGAGGFVCSEIALALMDAGWRVVAVDREFDEATRQRLSGMEQVTGQLPQVLDTFANRRLDAVVHGAALTAPPSVLGLSRAEHLAANTVPLTSALTIARKSGAQKFLFLSSMGVFAASDSPLSKSLMTEATRPTATCAYCMAKRAGELITAAAREPGFDTLSLRLGNTCGPFEATRTSRPYVSRIRCMTDAAEAGAAIPVPAPQAVREWAWMPQVAQGVATLMRDGFVEFPAIHAGTPPAIKDIDLANAVAGRRPGSVLDAANPATENVRPPMGSIVASPFSSIDWLSVDRILDRLMAVEAVN